MRRILIPVLTIPLGIILLTLLVVGASRAESEQKTTETTKKASSTEATAAEDRKYKYIGATMCMPCHLSPAVGAQYTKWKAGPHAKAWETLGTEKAAKIAEKMGLGDPREEEKCLKCHVTAILEPPERRIKMWKKEDGVNCESCHGPGSDYSDATIMIDRAKAEAHGLWTITEETCTTCHNEESPTYKPFNFEEAVKVIAHPRPPKE